MNTVKKDKKIMVYANEAQQSFMDRAARATGLGKTKILTTQIERLRLMYEAFNEKSQADLLVAVAEQYGCTAKKDNECEVRLTDGVNELPVKCTTDIAVHNALSSYWRVMTASGINSHLIRALPLIANDFLLYSIPKHKFDN